MITTAPAPDPTCVILVDGWGDEMACGAVVSV